MKYFIGLIGVLICLQSFGQDVIYKKDGSKIEAKVLSVNATEVIYKKFKNLEGAEYTLLKSQISTIIYENGNHEIFDVDQTVKKPPYVKPEVSYGRNIVGTNYFDLLARRVSVSYEHISLDGKLGLRIPFSVSWDENANSELNFGTYVRFKTGFDINFYLSAKGKLRYSVGPSFRVRKEVENEFLRFSGEKEDFSTIGVYLNNGVLLQLNGGFNISINYGIGLKSRNRAPDNINETSVVMHGFLEGNVGMRF